MWLYLPKPFVPSSAELADSTKQSTWQPQEVKLWFMSSGKAMQSPLFAKRWKTRSWIKLLSGTTLHPSMAALGVERYRQSLEDFHVPTCPSRAKKKASSKATGQASSLNTSALLTKYDPDTSSWRTSQASLITGQWELYLENFPKSGCLVNGECFQRPEWAVPINAREFSSWPTPSSQLAGEGPLLDNLVTREGEPVQLGERAYNPETGKHVQMTLNRATSAWPTPNTRDTRLGCNQRQLAKEADAWPTPRALEIDESVESHEARMAKRTAEGKELPSENLSITSKKWPTPRSREGNAGESGSQGSKHNAKKRYLDGVVQEKWPTPMGSDQYNPATERERGQLRESAILWPTASVSMVKGHYSEEAQTRKDGKSRTMARLDNAAVHVGPNSKNWLTPAAREDAACPQSQRMLTHQAKEFPCKDPTGPQDPTNGNNGSKSLENDPTSLRLLKRLNPRFVEWLMGHPIGWSSVRKIETKDYNAWVTASSRLLERLLSGSCGKG